MKPPYPRKQWKCAIKHKPEPYDLVIMELENGRCFTGWWTGFDWDSLRDIKLPVVAYRGVEFQINHANPSYDDVAIKAYAKKKVKGKS